MGNQNDITADSVELNVHDGVAFIEQASPLTRLHYFDGKFLKADALAQEQTYHRTQVQLANLAGGWGVVHGLGLSLSGDAITVTGGLAITPAGHFVMTLGDVSAKIADLLKLAAPAPAVVGNAELGYCAGQHTPGGVKETAALGLYEITVGPIEGLCGNEPVYGALCESACVSDSRHPYWREGLVLRLRPITLQLPTSAKVPLSTTHLINRVASAYFAAEPGATSSALSGSGLVSGVWCNPASLYGRDEVVIGLLTRDGTSSKIDAWSARRERMQAQAQGYWQGRMAMRPWNVYLAQILQFQCQLSGVFDDGSVIIETPSNCDDLRAVLDQTRKEIAALHKKYADSTSKIVEKLSGKPTQAEAKKLADEVKGSYADLYELSEKLSGVEVGQGALPKHRLLINKGFVQLPPAGYLPVQPGKTSLPDQLSRLFGEGVRLHYRAARPDVLPHLLEEAQHMERISLTQGIDQPDALEEVEIFVPDGRVTPVAAQATGLWWDTSIHALGSQLASALGGQSQTFEVKDGVSHLRSFANQKEGSAGFAAKRTLAGLTRTEAREDGSFGLTMVGSTQQDDEPEQAVVLSDSLNDLQSFAKREGNFTVERDAVRKTQLTAYVAADMALDPFTLEIGDDVAVKAELRMLNQMTRQTPPTDTLGGGQGQTQERTLVLSADVAGSLTVLGKQFKSQGRTELLVELKGVTHIAMVLDDAPVADRDGTMKIRLTLIRRGDGSTGVLLIDDALQTAKIPPVAIDWDDQPRVATVSMELSDERYTDTLTGGQDTMPGGTPPAPETIEFANLRALSQAPQPTSAIGADALSALVLLSEATDDQAFLVRSRKRLFPALSASQQVQIEAVLDWVMFRRLRPTFCDPVCAAPVQSGTEAFQIWHARVDSPSALKALQKALDQGDAQGLADFKFQNVGVLRYRDDNTQPEESHAKVLAMWQHAKPGAKVVLGRSWETNPTAGQGWQNHFRLREMLKQISSLTTPPTKGDGAIATLSQAPGPMAQAGLDGGMLIITSGAALVDRHRVIFMTDSMWGDLEPSFKQGAEAGYKELVEMLSNPDTSFVDITVDMLDNQLNSEGKAALTAANTEIQGHMDTQNPLTRLGILVHAQTVPAAIKPQVQHQAIMDVVKGIGNSDYKLSAPHDLGESVSLISLVVLREVFAQ